MYFDSILVVFRSSGFLNGKFLQSKDASKIEKFESLFQISKPHPMAPKLTLAYDDEACRLVLGSTGPGG